MGVCLGALNLIKIQSKVTELFDYANSSFSPCRRSEFTSFCNWLRIQASSGYVAHRSTQVTRMVR